MSFDCKYKTGPDECRRRKDGVCRPGEKGCVLYGKYLFPFKDSEPAASPGRDEEDPDGDGN